MEGSVFPTAALISAPPAILASVVAKLHETEAALNIVEAGASSEIEERIFLNSALWSGFIFLVGFLTVFRTSHSYNRFWEACASVHKMGAEWFDACSALMSYTKFSKAEATEIFKFQNRVLRLFSMLHAVALAELEDLDNGNEELEVRSFELELVDAGAFDDETLAAVRDSSCRVELVYQWIQSLVVEAQDNGVLNIPPPILTRSFQELSGGMVCFHDAMKVADTPFPFPYLQTCDVLLFVLYIASPFVVSTYANTFWLAGFFCFVLIFTFSCLTLTGLELEFPFGRDPNDIQGADLQLEMNHKLRLLVSAASWRSPQLRRSNILDDRQFQVSLVQNIHAESDEKAKRSFSMLWSALPASQRRQSWPELPDVIEPPDDDGRAQGIKPVGSVAPQFSIFKAASLMNYTGSRKSKKPARRNTKVRQLRMQAGPNDESYLQNEQVTNAKDASPRTASPIPASLKKNHFFRHER